MNSWLWLLLIFFASGCCSHPPEILRSVSEQEMFGDTRPWESLDLHELGVKVTIPPSASSVGGSPNNFSVFYHPFVGNPVAGAQYAICFSVYKDDSEEAPIPSIRSVTSETIDEWNTIAKTKAVPVEQCQGAITCIKRDFINANRDLIHMKATVRFSKKYRQDIEIAKKLIGDVQGTATK